MPKKEMLCRNCKSGNLFLQSGLTLVEIPIERIFFYIDPRLNEVRGEWDIRIRCDNCKNPKLSLEEMATLKQKMNAAYANKHTKVKVEDTDGGEKK